MSGREPFGARLAAARAARGPLCVGIDPHPALLDRWGLPDDVQGLERFALTVVDALAGRVAVLKPQVAFFERHGSRGIAVLERVLADAASAGCLTIADAKRGDIGSTMAAYADAFAGEGSPLAADAVTASPYLGFGSLDPLLDLAAATGRGVFVLALTSNPEGAQVQHAVGNDGRAVAQAVLDAVRSRNAASGQGPGQGTGRGSVGAVVGATIAAGRWDLRTGGPLLAPGIGAQGAGAGDLRRIFEGVLDQVLPSTSREVLGAGPRPSDLAAAADRALDAVRDVLSTPALPPSAGSG